MVKKDSMIAERDALSVEREVVLTKKVALLEEKNDVIGILESVISASAGPREIEELKARLSLLKAEKELERHKARHFRLQVASTTAAKQAIQLKLDSNVEYAKGLRGLLDTLRNSVEAALAQERATADQAMKVQKADAFCNGFKEGSRPPVEWRIQSPEEYEEQIGFFKVVDRFVSTPANLHLPDPSLVSSPSFNPNSFFATSDSSQ